MKTAEDTGINMIGHRERLEVMFGDVSPRRPHKEREPDLKRTAGRP